MAKKESEKKDQKGDEGKIALKKFDLGSLRIETSKQDQIEQGRKIAAAMPAKTLGTYKPTPRDVVEMIRSREDKMIPELMSLRHERLIKNAFTFFRGTAEVMERDFRNGPQSGILVMTCGDAHLNNFGFFASPERQLLFGLNDFDEARVSCWESDLKRLMVSVQLTGEVNGFSDEANDRTLIETAEAYEDAVRYCNDLKLLDRYYLSFNIDDLLNAIPTDDNMAKVLRKIANRAPKNNSDKVVRKFTEERDGKVVFKENPPRARRVPDDLYQKLLDAFEGYRASVSLDVRLFLSNFQVTDMIRYSVGVGSFGTRCYLVLLTGKDGSHLVLQVKEALPSMYDLVRLSAPEALEQGFEEGRRVITGQRILQPFYDPFLGYTNDGERYYYIRQFRDMKDSIDTADLDEEGFSFYAQLCARILAIAHFQSPTAPMIFGYLDECKKFSEHMTAWAKDYSKQVHDDYESFGKYLRGE